MSAPFTTAEAATVGVTCAQLRGPRVERQLRGVYVPACGKVSEAVRLASALLVLPPGSAVDGVSALRLLGVGLGSSTPLRFVTSHPHPVRRPEVRVRRTSSAMSPTRVRGLPCLPAAEAFVAAATELDLVELTAAGDWLVHLGLTSAAELLASSAAASGRGSRTAKRAARLVRERVDSPQETRLRLAIVLAGLPEPEVNPVVLARGRPVGRVDLLLSAYRTVIEYEGDQHMTDRRQWNRDVWRQEQLVGDGQHLVRVTAERMQAPRTVILTIHETIVEGGCTGPAPEFDEEWRRLFATVRSRT